jgi:hypothetical protein
VLNRVRDDVCEYLGRGYRVVPEPVPHAVEGHPGEAKPARERVLERVLERVKVAGVGEMALKGR